MNQHQLEPQPGHRDGATYDPKRDFRRLNTQAGDVWRLMKDGRWRSLREIAARTGYDLQSVSARLRDYRKPRFGSHVVEREYVGDGLWHYRLVPRRDTAANSTRK